MVELVVAPSTLQTGDAAVMNRSGVPANVVLKDGATKAVGTAAADIAAGNRGLPSGGLTGQVPVKNSGTSYDVSWADQAAGLGGDVVGPAGAVNSNPVLFNGTTGKLLKEVSYSTFKSSLSLAKGDVGLGNVDNTSDANKPISDATATALAGKANTSAIPDAEAIQDIVGAMVTGNTETNISVSYNDSTGKLDFVASAGGSGGGGDVFGPSSSVADAPALFSDTTGKVVKAGTYADFKTALGLANVADGSGGAVLLSGATAATVDTGQRFFNKDIRAGDNTLRDLRIGTEILATDVAVVLSPDADGLRDFGTATRKWGVGHFRELNVNGTIISGAELPDPNFNAISLWDDAAGTGGEPAWAVIGTGLSLIGAVGARELQATGGGSAPTAATSAEINTGTDNAKMVTPQGLKGSNTATGVLQMSLCDINTSVTAGSYSLVPVAVPAAMAGMNIVRVAAVCNTAGVGASGTLVMNVERKRGAAVANVMSTGITMGPAAYAVNSSTTGTINTANDDLAEGDALLAFCVSVSFATSVPKGVTVLIEASKP